MAQSSSRLPVEIWRRIFKHATHVPRELDTIQDLPVHTTVGAANDLQDAIVAKYNLRRTIVLVCRTWNEVGTPILYQSVVIRRLGRTMSSLNAALKPRTRRNPVKFASASFIRRIDIILYREESENLFRQQRNGFKDLDFLLSLLKQSPMLRIFTIDMFSYPIAVFTHLDQFLKKLYEMLPLSLKTFGVHLLYTMEPEHIDENWTLSVNLPHHSLDTINLLTKLPIAVFNVGNVRSLEIVTDSFRVQNTSRINVPSALTTLRILNNNSEDLECLKELGKQIESLEICMPREEHRLPMHLEAIARYCTRLDTLVIRRWNGSLEAIRSSSFPPLGIRRLGYNLGCSMDGEELWDRTFDIIKDLCRSKSLPNLKEFFFHQNELLTTRKDFMIYMQSQARSLHEVTGVKTYYKTEKDACLVPVCSF